MSPETLQFILLALEALPKVVAAGADLAAEASALTAQLRTFASEGRDPTAAEFAAQRAKMQGAADDLASA